MNSAKRIIAGAAEDMEEYVARTQVEIPLFSQCLQTGLTAFANAASLYCDFPQEDTSGLQNALQNIKAMRSKSAEARNSITGMRGSVAQLPRLTSVLNRAKRKTLATLDELLRQFETGERLATEVEQTIENLLEQ
jgi:hypothetical protein